MGPGDGSTKHKGQDRYMVPRGLRAEPYGHLQATKGAGPGR